MQILIADLDNELFENLAVALATAKDKGGFRACVPPRLIFTEEALKRMPYIPAEGFKTKVLGGAHGTNI